MVSRVGTANRREFLSAFLFNGKTGRSGGTTNGTVHPTGNLFEKKRNNFRRIPLFCFETKIPGISLNHLPRSHSRNMLLVRYTVYFPFYLILQRNNCFFFYKNGKRSRIVLFHFVVFPNAPFSNAMQS